MHEVMVPPQIYGFLYLISELSDDTLDKKILDCGAGGPHPPLALFNSHGFETHGVDISDSRLSESEEFCRKNGIDLNIKKGDMRNLPHENGSFSYVYSYNSIFHLTKADTAKAMGEMRRVLREQGLLYVNFISIEDQGFGEGEEVGPGEWKSIEHGEPTVHSYYEDTEPDMYFSGMHIIYKEKKIAEIRMSDYKMVTLEYVAHKKQ